MGAPDHRLVLALAALGLALGACDSKGAGADKGDPAGPGGPEGPICPDSKIPVGPGGACVSAGPQGCADRFLDPLTGLCDVATFGCGEAEVAHLEEGCVAVGAPGCGATARLPASGLCEGAAICSTVERATSAGGCEPVGVPCDPGHLDPATGHCMPSCPGGGVPAPGLACAPLSCGEGDFGDLPVLPDAIHVLGEAAAGGDGSREAPLASLGEALALVAAEGTILLGAGTWQEPVTPSAGLSLRGRCPELTILGGGVSVVGPLDVSLEGLTLSAPGVALSGTKGAQLGVSGIVISGAVAAGIRIDGAGTSLAATELLVEDVAPNDAGEAGFGLRAEGGAQATLTHAAVARAHEAAVSARDTGTKVLLHDVGLYESLPRGEEGLAGHGLLVEGGAWIDGLDVLVRDAWDSGLAVRGKGSRLDLRYGTVHTVQPREGGGLRGWGIEVSDGALALLGSVLVEGAHDVAVRVDGPGSALLAAGLRISETAPAPKTQKGGFGLSITAGGAAQVQDVEVLGSHGVGVLVAGEQTTLVGQGVRIADVAPQAVDEHRGRGLQVQAGARVEGEGWILAGTHESGISVSKGGASVELSGSVVIGVTGEVGSGSPGRGVTIDDGAWVHLVGSEIAATSGAGLVVRGAAAELELDEILVSDVGGAGVLARDAAEVVADAVEIRGAGGLGVAAVDPGSSVDARDLVIRDVGAAPDGGWALAAIQGAEVDARGLVLEGFEGIGLFAGGAGSRLDVTEALSRNEAPAPILWAQHEETVANISGLVTRGGGVVVRHAAVSLGQALLDGSAVKAVSDGIAALDADLALQEVRVQGYSRAGLALEQGGGQLLAITSYGGAYGLALQEAPDVYFDEACVFAGGVADVAEDEGIPLPDEDLGWPEAVDP